LAALAQWPRADAALFEAAVQRYCEDFRGTDGVQLVEHAALLCAQLREDEQRPSYFVAVAAGALNVDADALAIFTAVRRVQAAAPPDAALAAWLQARVRCRRCRFLLAACRLSLAALAAR
jgi:hypothetical protein